MKIRTLYDVLNVSPNATPDVIKAAYAVLRRGADKGGDPAAVRLLKDAYDTLADSDARARYDEKIGASHADEPPAAAIEPAASAPAWSRALVVVLAFAAGYAGASMWHQRAITRMVLEHQAALATQQNEIARLNLAQREREMQARNTRLETERERRSREAAERKHDRAVASLRSRLERESSAYQRSRQREYKARERKARRQAELERRQRVAENDRNAALAQQRLAQEKRELERLYRENYPQCR